MKAQQCHDVQPSCGIGQDLYFVKMHCSLDHALMMHLEMKSNGQCLSRKLSWVYNYNNCWFILVSLKIIWSIIKNCGLERHIELGSTILKKQCNKQHSHSWPAWIVHIHRHQLPQVLSWGEHFVAFNHILNITPIFHHADDYFEYFLRDPMYMGERMFIMCRIR